MKHGSEYHAEEGRGENTVLFHSVRDWKCITIVKNMPSCNWRTSAVNFLGQPNFSIICHSPSLQTVSNTLVNHFSTTGRCSGPAYNDVSIRQAARAAFVTSSFKIIFNTNFSAMRSHLLYRSIAFEGDDSAIQWCQCCVSLSGSLFNILQLFAIFSQNPKLLQWRTVLTTLATFRIMY